LDAFFNNAALRTVFDALWAQTKSTASPAGRCEYGCYITLDTATGMYGITPPIEGDPYPVNSTTVYSNLTPPRPPDSSVVPSVPHDPLHPTNAAVYVVGHFHTHPPRERWQIPSRVGPSGGMGPNGGGDEEFVILSNVQTPGIVYDYVAMGDIPEHVPPRWSRDNPRKLYAITGPNNNYHPPLLRRPTP